LDRHPAMGDPVLIVAIPKSASTSLLRTLGRLHDIAVEEAHFVDLKVPDGIERLHEHHPDIVELTSREAERVADQNKIYKQHFPPTLNNVELLRDQPVVVLLRDESEVLDAYQRAFKTYAMKKPASVDRHASGDHWRRHAVESGLDVDLQSFTGGWTDAAHDNLHFVDYADLVADPSVTVNAIERFWNLPETPGPIELDKARYTRSRSMTVKRFLGQKARQIGIYDGVVRVLNQLGLRR